MQPISRTVNLIEPRKDQRFGQDGLSLQDFDSDRGYVLLGEPGMGKSTEFDAATRGVDGAHLISARRFIRSNLDHRPEWRTGTIFIDGLDEMRVGRGDPRAVLDKIIYGLEALGIPKFRLSCRSANWLGPGDGRELGSLLGSKEIPVLRLNPLNDDGIWEFVSQRGQDANTFIQQAREYGMDALLGNPKLLDFLITSIEAEDWPDSQLKMLENACRELARERNKERRDALSSALLQSREATLTAAGKLSACMLIANKAGWARDDTDDPEFLSILDLECGQDLCLRAALDSRIFNGSPRSKIPIHRLVAEFLGARYLSTKIQDGLSVRRALSLLMEHNGVLLPDLRGLAAWLAALNGQARTILIQIDPSTVAFNGDTKGFSPAERNKLLANLEQQIHLNSNWPSAAALNALTGNEGIPIIQDLTNSPERSKNRQMLVYLLLRGFSQMYSHASASDWRTDHAILMNIVRDQSWQSNVRCEALGALSRILHRIPQRGTLLRDILQELQEKHIPDEKHDLQGTLLDLTYPDELRPAEIWDYLVAGPITDFYSGYHNFFASLVDRSNENQIKELLDSLCDHASEAIPKLENQRLSDIVIQLLARGLELFGDELCIPELYRWFSLVEFDYSLSQLISVHTSRPSFSQHDEANRAIRNWLNQRESVRYSLIEHGLLIEEAKIGSEFLIETIALKFVGRSAPEGIRLWCLGRAVQLWDSSQNVAREFASWSITVQDGWGPPLSDKKIISLVSDIPGLVQWNDQRLKDKAQAELEMSEIRKKQEEIRAVYQKRRQEKLDIIRQQQTDLAKGQCMPIILDELAHIYFDNPCTDENNPQTCLQSYFEGDGSLVQATLAGFRSLLDREDLPDLDQITQLYENGKRSYFALPFLAGLEEAYNASNDLSYFSETGIRRALGFYLITESPRQRYLYFPQNSGDHIKFPTWYKRALQCYPEAVADSLVSVHNADVRSKNPPNAHLYEMAFDPAYVHVAKLAVHRMFTVFPSRCSARKLESLRVVLWSGIRNNGLSVRELQNIILKRLNRKQMDIGQRTQWLAAGLFADRKIYFPELINFLSTGEDIRVHHAIDFLVPGDREPLISQDINKWNPDEIRRLIQALRKRVHLPILQDGAVVGSDELRISYGFRSLFTLGVEELKKRTCDDARKALDRLASDASLTAWKREIVLAQERQAGYRRAAKHSDLSLEQIQKTLNNGPPANAADLVGLTLGALEKLADEIRNGPTSGWRQYWDWGQTPRRPMEPKPENDCRDILLSSLATELERYQVDALPEGHYADDRRADIRISFGSNLAVPIEIKKNSHVDIWRGITEQLVPKYTRDPKSDGYGVYLVFWFGAEHMKVVSPDGGIPQEPTELKDLLETQLDPEIKKRIHVAIIDVARSGRFSENKSP
jgi:hypothetical protein